jgi:hypothetical protein
MLFNNLEFIVFELSQMLKVNLLKCMFLLLLFFIIPKKDNVDNLAERLNDISDDIVLSDEFKTKSSRFVSY